MRVPLRFRLARLRRRRIPPAVLAAVCALLLFAAFLSAVNQRLQPVLETFASSGAKNRVTALVSGAVADCVAQQGFGYADFVQVRTDAEGQVTALTSSLAAAGALREQAAAYIIRRLEGVEETHFGVPLGTLTGWAFLSGRGPEVRARILSVGDVALDLRHDFSDAGINQTVHRIYLDISVSVYLALPGKVLPVTADSCVCVAETVIVGQVPGAYLNIGNGAR